MKKHKKKSRKKKGQSQSGKGESARFSHVPEIIIALMLLSILAGFITPSPWSIILLAFGLFVFPFILYPLSLAYQKNGRKSRKRHYEREQNQAEEPGWVAVQLMYGLKRKDHYKDLPPEVRAKSLFGKRD